MWATFYMLCIIAVASVSSLEFYKGVEGPWAIREAPTCVTDACPEDEKYTWDFYFDKILSLGARNLVFGGYELTGSEIVKRNVFHPPWDEKAFNSLHQRMSARKGRIMGSLSLSYGTHVDEAAFEKNARSFLKKYPVDGFVVKTHLYDDPKEWHSAFKALKPLGLDVGFEIDSSAWEALKKSGIPQKADINFVPLYCSPLNAYDVRRFNTDGFAIETIVNATRAGAKPESIVLLVPLAALTTYEDGSFSGYSSMIYDFEADPKGNGSVINDQTTKDGFYFFSQTRAVDKIAIAHKHKLRGIMLDMGDYDMQDLYPWDASSLFYSLASNMKNH